MHKVFMKFWIILLTLVSQITIRLPVFLQKIMGGFWGWLWIDVLKIRKKDVIRHVGNVFPEWSDEQKFQVARHSIYLLGYQFYDFSILSALNSDWFEKNVVIHGIENFTEAQKKDRGVLLLTLHMGSPDVALSAMAHYGIKPCLISKRFNSKFFTDLWFYLRTRTGAKVIDAHGKNNAFEIFAALKNKSSVVFVLDQYMGPPYGVETEFFGIKTGTAYGLALFAKKTQAPVVPMYCIRTEDHKHHIYFEPAVPLVEEENKDLYLTKMTQEYNHKLEKIIQRHPEQWMWVHRRWKKW